MAESPSEKREADQKIPGKGKLDKYKWYLVGGLGLVAVLVFYFVNKSKSSASTAGTGSLAASGIDPATGVPYSQEYAQAYGAGMGMSPYGGGGYGGSGGFGGTGPAGPAGPAGKTGPTGKTGPKGPGSHKKKDPDPHKKAITKKGSRTQAMTNAAAARRDWNTRIIPSPIRHSYRV